MSGEAVKVVVRCRPLNEREKALNSEVVVIMDPSIVQVQLCKPNAQNIPPKLFTFDGVYYIEDTTQQIYEDICFPLVSGVLEGYNGTVFAYGQTGCGKSFTMMGVEDPKENQGVIPRSFGHIFDHIAVNESIKYLVRASYLEIYNEEVRDLLGKDAKRKLDLHEHPDKGVYVKGLSYHKVHNAQDLEHVMELGSSNRSVGATLMNVDSSRSHSIFTIDLEMMDQKGGPDGEGSLRAGKLNLVDLAGSERQSKTGSTGERLKEATKINLSLSALGNVISALVDGKSKHIPYRDSKLTRLLQSSLGGNTKTLMVACVSPSDNNYDETLSTLRYANRAKNIKNKPRINEDPKDALLREYQEEIKKLKLMLMGKMPVDIKDDDKGGGISHQSSMTSQRSKSEPSQEHLKAWEEEKEAIRREYEANMAELKEKFGREQANKEQLQQELNKLQEERDQQLLMAKSKLELSEETTDVRKTQETQETQKTLDTQETQQTPETQETQKTLETQKTQEIQETQKAQEAPEEKKIPTIPSIPPTSPTHPGVEPAASVEMLSSLADKDKNILREHELAFQRLEELQNELIGGEKAADEELKKNYQERKEAVAERQMQLTKASSLFDDEDENVLEKIFNSLTDEVRVKTQVIERTKAKLLSAEEDIKDLQGEFELDRQDYLDTIRTQEKHIKLYEQLLATVVPCLRRDCNYFNIDKIRTECEWNEETKEWSLPKLTINKTILSPAPLSSKGSTSGNRKGSKGSNVGSTPVHHFQTKFSHSGDMSMRDSSSSLLSRGHGFTPSSCENFDDDRSSHIPRSEDSSSEYFKPKRALELIGQLKDFSPNHSTNEGAVGGGMPVGVRSSGSLSSLPNAATVHGVTPLMDSSYGRRPGKLQSLAINPPVPQPFSPKQEPDILEKMEKLSTRKKNNLEPLADIKTTKRHPH